MTVTDLNVSRCLHFSMFSTTLHNTKKRNGVSQIKKLKSNCIIFVL